MTTLAHLMYDRRRNRLINRIADMIADQTYNRAPVNYTIAEKAVEMVERSMARARRDER